MHPILVAYGSKNGATAQIAERIAAVLRSHDLPVDLRPAAAAGPPERYHAIVLGSAVYMRRWRADARHLLRRVEHTREAPPMWLFSSGPFGDMPAEADKLVPRHLRAAPSHVLFGGRVSLQPKNMVERAMLRNTPEDKRDARDWDAIEAWAAEIAAACSRARPWPPRPRRAGPTRRSSRAASNARQVPPGAAGGGSGA
jgi:menaquinone-dependent protoporphyrinogen oxidase